MTEHRIVDEFNRTHVFQGEELLSETSDDGRRPRWVDMTVWRTPAGKYVVLEETSFRVRHLNPSCSRARGYDLVPADDEDCAACPECNPAGLMATGWAQQSRTNIVIHDSAAAFVNSINANKFTRYCMSKLAEVDERISSLWSIVVVE